MSRDGVYFPKSVKHVFNEFSEKVHSTVFREFVKLGLYGFLRILSILHATVVLDFFKLPGSLVSLMVLSVSTVR